MRRIWAAALLTTAALAGCGEGDAASAAQRGSGGRAGPGGFGPRVAAVEVAPVEQGSIARAVTVSGVVEPIRSIGINSQLAGALLAVEAEEGDVVHTGEVLARLDARELRAQLAAAQAAYQVAEAGFQRAEQLRERSIITLPEYERERTAYAAAKAQVTQLQTRLDYSSVQAPIDGIVTAKNVEAGDVVAPQTRLFTIADVSTLVMRAGVSELDVVELSEGDPVEIALDAFPGRTLEGRIRRVFPAADPTTRLVPVEVALTGENARVARPGFLARATFALDAREDVLLVPAAALVRGAGSEAVFVVEDGKAVRRTVTTGLNSEGRIEIVSGLRAGEPVIVAGNNTLRDGTQVRVVAASGQEPAGGAAARP